MGSSVRLAEVRRLLSRRSRPATIRGCPCCIDEDAIRKMIDEVHSSTPPGGNWTDPNIDEDHLGLYVCYTRFTVGGPDDFAYLLPNMLRVWQKKLESTAWDDAFVEHFHDTLRYGIRAAPHSAGTDFFAAHLTGEEREAVLAFMRDALLEEFARSSELSVTRGTSVAYVRHQAFAAYGSFAADIPRLWTDWWSFPTPGSAIVALQFASCLLFGADENPIFAPWTTNRGGGPPFLVHARDRILSDRWGWLPHNVEFLLASLTVSFLEQRLNAAAELLDGTGRECARLLLDRAQSAQSDLSSSIAELVCDLL